MSRIYKRRRQGILSKYYYIDLNYGGKRIQWCTHTSSKKKAEEILSSLENKILNERFDLDELNQRKKIKSFNEVADYWLENYSKKYHSPKHYKATEERIRKHLKPFFGNYSLKSITPKLIGEYITKKKEENLIKDATINRTLTILSKIFSNAIDWGYTNQNPVRKVKRLYEQREGFDYLTREEVARFLEACSPNFKPIAMFASYTGARAGEIVGLKWKDMNLEKKLIRIERSESGLTKSKKERYLPINKNLLPVLTKLHQNAKSEYVFPNPYGEMRKPDFRNALNYSLEKAGLRRIRFHDLRHTFAANFLMSGGRILVLNKYLGHSTLEMTMRYAHLSPDFVEGEIDKLDYERTEYL